MSTASLQTMQKEALDIYELAQVARFRATAEQERAESLLSSIQATEKAARELLQKVGLAHIVGTPLQLDENAAPIRRSDQVLAQPLPTYSLPKPICARRCFVWAKALPTKAIGQSPNPSSSRC